MFLGRAVFFENVLLS